MERRRLTPATRTGLDDLAMILAEVRRTGYCIVDQELEVGLISIGVPVFNSAGVAIAAVNVASSPARVPKGEMAQRFLPALRNMQNELRPLIRA
jgi:IclR family pca regulon transcriptional regulator